MESNKITIEEQIAFVEQELEGYGEDSGWEDEAISMKAIQETLKLYKRELMGEGGEVYNKCMSLYFAFYRSQTEGLEPRITAAQGKALKEIIKHLRRNSHTKDDEGAINSLFFIFNAWDKLSKFIQQQVQLTQINKNLNEIIFQLKKGHYDKQAKSEQEERQLDDLDRAIADSM